MEEQELRCPWCGGPLEKGQLWGDDYGFMKEGCRGSFLPAFKRVTEKENYIWFRNWVDNPPGLCLPLLPEDYSALLNPVLGKEHDRI